MGKRYNSAVFFLCARLHFIISIISRSRKGRNIGGLNSSNFRGGGGSYEQAGRPDKNSAAIFLNQQPRRSAAEELLSSAGSEFNVLIFFIIY